MSFDWMVPKVGQAVRERAGARTREAGKRELRERARILMNLGYSRAEATARCKRTLEWEHDSGPGSSLAKDVDAIVGEVYDRK